MDLTTIVLVISVGLVIFLLAIAPAIKNSKVQKRWEEKHAEERRLWEKAQKEKMEKERLRTTVVATRLIGEGAAEYKRSVGDMLVRGAVGGILGGKAGATLGMATTKSRNTNRNVRRFLVKYLDGHIEEQEATIGSARYKEYMDHLVWENESNN